MEPSYRSCLTLTLCSILLASSVVGQILQEHEITRLAAPPLPHPEVAVKQEQVPCDVQDEDLQQLYKDNLEPDFRLWRKQKLDVSRVLKLDQQRPDTDTIRLVLIYNNTLYFVHQSDPSICEAPCNRYLEDVYLAFKYWTKQYTFPNTLFKLSLADTHRCYWMSDCAAPILSPAKRFLKESPDFAVDILVPKAPTRAHATFFRFPWDKKADKAIWRGTRWCDHGVKHPLVGCSRFYMGEWHKNSTAVREAVDFGFTDGWNEVVPRMDVADYARFKFILNLDGFTAAYRLSKLLLMDSAVLKEESDRGEYYYRSMQPWVHYIPVFRDNATDLLDVMAYWSHPSKQTQLQRIAAQANAFSARNCCPRARMLYWRQTLVEYRKLFPDMDAAIQDKWWPMVRSRLREVRQGAAG